MDVSEYLKIQKNYVGKTQCPKDFSIYWGQKIEECKKRLDWEEKREEYGGKYLSTKRILYRTLDGGEGRADYISPLEGKIEGMVILFTDAGREIRGRHYLSRFPALGYAVLALGNRNYYRDHVWHERDFKDVKYIEQAYTDSFLMVELGKRLYPKNEKEQEMQFFFTGEGFGGSLAVTAAYMLHKKAGCMILNPCICDLKAGMELYDTRFFAREVKADLLMGTSLMDTISEPLSQAALYHSFRGKKYRRIYPKYGHERINFFENEMLVFMREGKVHD